MKNLFFFLITLLLANEALAQPFYIIPFANQQPQYVFPLYFENGDGQRDTIYTGYEPNRNTNYMPELGEFPQKYDTTRIQAYLGVNSCNFCGIWETDSLIKATIFMGGIVYLRPYRIPCKSKMGCASPIL